MRLSLIIILIVFAFSSHAQKRELPGNQTYWRDVNLPQDDSGGYQFSGHIPAQADASPLYEKAMEWISINTGAGYNQLISQDFEKKEHVFQRSFNYYFWQDTRTPHDDNKIIVYRVKLSMEDAKVYYQLSHFQHDHLGQLMPVEDYLELPFVTSRIEDQIKSQMIMHVYGFIWKNGEEKGFLDVLTRVMNTIAVEK